MATNRKTTRGSARKTATKKTSKAPGSAEKTTARGKSAATGAKAKQQIEARPSHADVARRAHELYIARGGRGGQDQRDWFQAEAELSRAR